MITKIKKFFSDLGFGQNKENPTLLNQSRAYEIYAGQSTSAPTLEKLFLQERDRILSSIKLDACYGYSYKLIQYPMWFKEDHKKRLESVMKELHYTILFTNPQILVITWAQ
jgi:hypothetical protein